MRRSIPSIFGSRSLGLLIALAIGALAGVRPAGAHGAGDPALAQIESDLAAGAIDQQYADLLLLRRIFAPESLPANYRDLAEAPLRCATPLIHQFTKQGRDLDRVVRHELEGWLTPQRALGRSAEHLSPGGHFRLAYSIEGTNAVPAEDVAPANGIPDFVERCATYLEDSWEFQFDWIGFVPPDVSGGPYEVSFQSMGSYGYTTTQGANGAGTRIVLNNDFLGFPPNDDPEGNAIGASKVTCVHELRHASQFATSGWSEPGLWVEVDATWIEDIAYDQVNDFYNYLSSGSPISNPTLPLDAGGSGSYEDCVWQHFLVERWGMGVMQAFWERRGTGTTEDVMSSYDWAMQQFGGSVLENFRDFAAWNLATGTRAWPGVGYQEASAFPTAPVSSQASALPASFTHPIQRYAARFYQVTGFTPGESGVANLTVTRAPNSSLRALAVVLTRSGTRVVEPLVLAGQESALTLATPLQDIAEITVVIAHGGIGLDTETVSLVVDQDLRPPLPRAQVDSSTVDFEMVAGTVATTSLSLSNIGEPGSWLQYKAVSAAPIPAAAADSTELGRSVARNITNSMVNVNLASYTPGGSSSRVFTVNNASPDFEWLAGVELSFPAGVTVLASTDFVGGVDGPLVSSGATGEGVTMLWSDLNGSWGNVRNGQSASATVWLSFDLQLVGDLTILYRVIGDGYGADPHEVSGALILDGPELPLFELLGPVPNAPLMIGSPTDIEWVAGFEGNVKIELSRDAGSTWETLAASTANDGHFEWLVTGPVSTGALLRLTEAGASHSVTSAQAYHLLEQVSWVSVSPAEAAIPASLAANLDLVFDASGLEPGVHEAELFFFHNGPTSPLRVPVRLEVNEGQDSESPTRQHFRIHAPSPNPFNPSTSVRFELFDPSRVRIDVYDVRGRFVRQLVDRELPAGPHSVLWDSRDEEGAFVSSGVYFYVARVEDEQFTGKVVLSK